MTTTHSYTFDKLGRIGDDECNLSQRNVQNAEFGSYSVQNYFLKYCGMKKPIEFATSQPNIFTMVDLVISVELEGATFRVTRI